MNILVLTKRQYTNKDLIDDLFGRLREIPVSLAKNGHNVIGICLSYQRKTEQCIIDENNSSSVCWYSFNSGWMFVPGFIRYSFKSLSIAKKTKPDFIIAASDSIYGILGFWISRKLSVPLVFDLYDNFSSFGLARFIPGLKILYRYVIRNAEYVTCVSNELVERVQHKYRRTAITLSVNNAVNKEIFFPMNKVRCRELLGLPQKIILIGTAGDLSRTRGIDILFSAFDILTEEIPDLHLVIAGPRKRNLCIPKSSHIHDLGILPHDKVAVLFNSLDTAVICNIDSDFGRYCFPQKAYEILSCHAPLVASDIGAMRSLLRQYPEYLFDPNQPGDLVRAIKYSTSTKKFPIIESPSWDNVTRSTSKLICGISAN